MYVAIIGADEYGDKCDVLWYHGRFRGNADSWRDLLRPENEGRT
jgi:hypothetical protein